MKNIFIVLRNHGVFQYSVYAEEAERLVRAVREGSDQLWAINGIKNGPIGSSHVVLHFRLSEVAAIEVSE